MDWIGFGFGILIASIGVCMVIGVLGVVFNPECPEPRSDYKNCIDKCSFPLIDKQPCLDKCQEVLDVPTCWGTQCEKVQSVNPMWNYTWVDFDGCEEVRCPCHEWGCALYCMECDEVKKAACLDDYTKCYLLGGVGVDERLECLKTLSECKRGYE